MESVVLNKSLCFLTRDTVTRDTFAAPCDALFPI